jgi:tetratricopeptide (TPR) repeat protein
VDDYTDNMFRSMKPNALVLSSQWDTWLSAAYTRQLIGGVRPDVAVIDQNLLRDRSWYYDQLRRAHPEVYRRSEDAIRAFVAELSKFERGAPVDVANALAPRWQELLLDIVAKNYDTRPIYVSREIGARDPSNPGEGPEDALFRLYRRVPEGLLFRLYRPADVPPPAQRVPDVFRYRPFARGGRLPGLLLGEYANMLFARAVYLDDFKLYEEAAPYYRKALAIMPDQPTILDWKRRNDAARGIVNP